MRMTAALVIFDHHELLTLKDLEMFEENKLTLKQRSRCFGQTSNMNYQKLITGPQQVKDKKRP